MLAQKLSKLHRFIVIIRKKLIEIEILIDLYDGPQNYFELLFTWVLGVKMKNKNYLGLVF